MSLNEKIDVLLIDNYDSFTFNIYQELGRFEGVRIRVVRNDEISLDEIKKNIPSCIIISPGPGSPDNERDFGVCREAILQLFQIIPILGVCLGHQGIGLLFGGKVIQASRVLHGKTSELYHSGKNLFEGIPNRINVARYHSLILDPATIPQSFVITGKTIHNEVMAISHRQYPIYGLQFHPESFMTEYGHKILENFLKIVQNHRRKETILIQG